jgi:glycosyltransferase involved in cell wall biosynthesis
VDRLAVSAVLVCMNNPGDVKMTLESLHDLIGENIEVIIIDSSSDDVIRHLIDSYPYKNVSYSYMKASGIYSAMNLGVKSCTPGNYIWFLNPGDILPNSDNFLSLFVGGIEANSPWIYGQASVIDTSPFQNFPRMTDNHSLAALSRGSLRISHQAMLVRTDIFHDLSGFDVRYKICSDLDFQLRLFNLHRGYFQEQVIALIDPNGISHQKVLTTYYETFLVRMRSGDMNFFNAASITIKNLSILILKKLKRSIYDI